MTVLTSPVPDMLPCIKSEEVTEGFAVSDGDSALHGDRAVISSATPPLSQPMVTGPVPLELTVMEFPMAATRCSTANSPRSCRCCCRRSVIDTGAERGIVAGGNGFRR